MRPVHARLRVRRAALCALLLAGGCSSTGVDAAPPTPTSAPLSEPAPRTTAEATSTTAVTTGATLVPSSSAPPPAPAMDHPRPCARCPEVQPDPAAPVVVTKPGAPPPVIARVPTSDPVVFVTIDDGRVANEDAATILVEARLPITLFLTGQFIADKLPYMHRIVDAGAWVEPHTITHPDLSRTAAQRNEVCEPVDTYGREFGRVGTLFRPPYGRFSQTTRNAAASCGLQAIILWKAATNDGEVQTQGKPLQAGDIVMMHFRDDLASNLRALFDAIIARGLRVGRLECYVGGDPRCGRDATSA